MIMQQCENCTKKGKNVYCNNCIKKADYFDVYSYDSSTRFDKGDIKGRIKAYTWHDVGRRIDKHYARAAGQTYSKLSILRSGNRIKAQEQRRIVAKKDSFYYLSYNLMNPYRRRGCR